MADPAPSAARRVLGVFAKRPVAGQVKTRLAAATSPDWAARVAEAFLLDVLDRLSVVDADRVLAFSPPGEQDFFSAIVGNRFRLVPQAEGDLGRRMEVFFFDELNRGAERVVLLGTDSPSLPLSFIDHAFDALQTADVVIGPATDGGYYLLGCSRLIPGIFQGVAWGTCQVLGETVAHLPADVRLALLPPWYDMDTLDDWRMLRGHLAALRRSGVDPGLPRVSALPEPRE